MSNDTKSLIIKEFEYLFDENKRLTEENIKLKQQLHNMHEFIDNHFDDNRIGRNFYE